MPRLTLIILALFPAAALADSMAPVLTARGNEPGWRLDLTATALDLTTEDGQTRNAPRPEPLAQGDGATLLATDGLSVTLWPVLCRDSMTGMPHPWQVRVETGTGPALSGCGGNPADLLAGDWRLVSAQGSPLPDGASIRFDADRISGRAACNRFGGSITLTGEGLRFTAIAATKMACPADAMLTDAALFAALSAVDRFDLDDTGRLLLIAGDIPVLEAAR